MTKSSTVRRSFSPCAVAAFAFATTLLTVPFAGASAQTLGYAPMQQQAYPQDQGYAQGYVNDAPQAADEDAQLPDRLRRQIVGFDRSEPAGTIVIDTNNTYLYYVLGNGRAIRYGGGVGRDARRDRLPAPRHPARRRHRWIAPARPASWRRRWSESNY